MNPRLQTRYGLKFHAFRPDVPLEALYTTPAVDSFTRRVEVGIADGGFVTITGDPGTGKSVPLRLLADRLRRLPDVLVGTVEQPTRTPATTFSDPARPAHATDHHQSS